METNAESSQSRTESGVQSIKKQFLIPAFVFILLGAGYIGYAGIIPYFGFPNITLDKKLLALEDPLVVHFDRSVVKHKIESSFSVKPSVVGKISWQDNNLLFQPISPWEPGKDYQVSLNGLNRIAVNYSFEDYFSIDSLPRVSKYSPAEGTMVTPDSPIEFNLDKSSQNCHLDFKIAPAFNYTLAIDQERKKFQIVPQQALAQDTSYQIIAYESYQSKDNKEWYQQEIANFQFKTISPPEVQKIIPADKQADINEFEPVKAYFSKPMKTDDWQNFIEITPSVQGKTQWEDEGKTFIFKPYRWAQNTEYAVKIKGGWKANDNSSLSRDFITTFRSYNSSGLVGKVQTANQDPKLKEGRYVDINLSKQLLTIFESGANMGTYKVSSGKRGMATPTGMFNIKKKSRRAWSKRYGLFMPYWMQFTNQGHGIHELPEWPSGYKEGANHLGVPVSHGCVRLGVGSAKTVYNFVDTGTPVYIHY